MSVATTRLNKLDEFYIEATQAIIQIHYELLKRPQNHGEENRELLKQAKDTLIINLNSFRNFDQ